MTSSPLHPIRPDAPLVQGVEPMRFERPVGGDVWPCTRCGGIFPVADSYAVHFDSSGRDLTFVVCPDCASVYGALEDVVIHLTQPASDGNHRWSRSAPGGHP